MLGRVQVEFTLSVIFGALSNDNFVCLQITERGGLQNVSFDTALETSEGAVICASEHNMFL